MKTTRLEAEAIAALYGCEIEKARINADKWVFVAAPTGMMWTGIGRSSHLYCHGWEWDEVISAIQSTPLTKI